MTNWGRTTSGLSSGSAGSSDQHRYRSEGAAGGYRERNLSTRSSCSSGSSQEIQYSEDWQDVVRCTLADMGVTDPRYALVTDTLGVEVNAFDKHAYAPTIDRFPLRVRCIVVPAPPSAAPRRSRTKESAVNEKPSQERMSRVTQISLEVAFAEVWPGIVDVKLSRFGAVVAPAAPYSAQSVDGGGGGGALTTAPFLVATDSMGVELDLSRNSTRVPSPERFPLKLHFMAPQLGPQNIPPRTWSWHSAGGGDSGTAGLSVLHEHSMELPMHGILSDIIDEKLRSIGLEIDGNCRALVLITDCTGVVVKHTDGVPSKARFPIKVHVERAAVMELDNQLGNHHTKRPWERRMSTRGRSGDSLYAEGLGCKLAAACENIMRPFARYKRA